LYSHLPARWKCHAQSLVFSLPCLFPPTIRLVARSSDMCFAPSSHRTSLCSYFLSLDSARTLLNTAWPWPTSIRKNAPSIVVVTRNTRGDRYCLFSFSGLIVILQGGVLLVPPLGIPAFGFSGLDRHLMFPLAPHPMAFLNRSARLLSLGSFRVLDREIFSTRSQCGSGETLVLFSLCFCPYPGRTADCHEILFWFLPFGSIDYTCFQFLRLLPNAGGSAFKGFFPVFRRHYSVPLFFAMHFCPFTPLKRFAGF